MKKLISRRNFLKAAALTGSALTLTACGGAQAHTPPAHEKRGGGKTQQTPFTINRGPGAPSPPSQHPPGMPGGPAKTPTPSPFSTKRTGRRASSWRRPARGPATPASPGVVRVPPRPPPP